MGDKSTSPQQKRLNPSLETAFRQRLAKMQVGAKSDDAPPVPPAADATASDSEALKAQVRIVFK